MLSTSVFSETRRSFLRSRGTDQRFRDSWAASVFPICTAFRRSWCSPLCLRDSFCHKSAARVPHRLPPLASSVSSMTKSSIRQRTFSISLGSKVPGLDSTGTTIAGFVAGAVPFATNTTTPVDLTGLTADEQMQAGLQESPSRNSISRSELSAPNYALSQLRLKDGWKDSHRAGGGKQPRFEHLSSDGFGWRASWAV